MNFPRAWNALTLLLCLFCLTASVRSQEGYKVVDIIVEGNKVSSKALILGSSGITLGSAFTQSAVSETIQRLYSLRIFSDVQVDAEQVNGGIKVYIRVHELPKLTSLDFSGSDKISHKDLKEKLGLGVGGYISPYLVFQKKVDIEKMYAEKGYFQATATPTLTYNADSTEAGLHYAIDAKSKVKVESVVITGTSRVKPGDLVGKMRNRKRGFLKSSDFAQEKYQEDLEKVTTEMHKRGFIDGYVVSDSTKIDSVNNQMTIYLQVYEGPCYYFGKTSFSGNEKLKSEYLAKQMKHEEGAVFDEEVYDKSLTEVYTSYHDIGHLHVRVDDERATRSDSILDITYTITEGLPSKIRYIPIVGNSKTKEKVIRREMPIFPGQTFNRSMIIETVRDLMALNFFTNVLPSPIDLPNGDIDLEMKVEEKQTGSVSAGAGYNSQDKLVGNVGIGIPNFRGMGQNLSFSVDFGSRRNSFTLSFTEPWLMGRPTSVGGDIFWTNRRWYDDYTEGRQGGSIRLGRRLAGIDKYLRGYASLRFERDKYHDFSDDFKHNASVARTIEKTVFDTLINSDIVPYTRQDTIIYSEIYREGSIVNFDNQWRNLSSISFSLIRDSRNLPEFATKGSRISYAFDLVGGPLGGYFNYQKHLFSAAKFFPLIGPLSLGVKAQVGGITRPHGDTHVLLSDQFSPGGTAYDGIVRGYDDGDLTPRSTYSYSDTTKTYYRDSNKTVITDTTLTTKVQDRGSYMFVTNIEMQCPIIPRQLYVLAFLDGGNSWATHKFQFASDLHWGTGLGFRLVIPGIGTLGFDFGYPLDNYQGQGQHLKPHFQIGTTFR